MACSSVAFSAVQWKYDVFLSFRGEDTRRNFTDHLYAALDHNGVLTFRDDERLERGKEISSEFLRAIKESRFSILVLSKNYAFSTWCLEELANIVDCIKEKQHTAFPVFYDVDPSDVRKQTGAFKKAFDKHENDFKDNKEKVERWRSALTLVANLSGWHLQDRLESEFIQKVVSGISRKLDLAFPTNIAKDLVGIESRVEALIPYLRLLSNNVRFIGMCGMGGIGKTTLARAVYDSLSNKFDGSCFLKNVREFSEKGGLIPLQEQLLYEVLKTKDVNIFDAHKAIRSRLRRKRVLLVLDDVDQLGQLQELSGAPDWFGHGSRIIITTRDEQLLIAHGVQYRYKVEGLNLDEARKLFHLKAFKHKQPEDAHFDLSDHVICYAQGLPLALEVLGSFLCDRSVDQWKSTLDRLEKHPEEKISKVLRISYDGLKSIEKKIFLDIACFFKGKDKDWVMEILDACEFYPKIGIAVLIEKSLITISDNKFWMHDLLQVMGWEIVRGQHPNKPGKWSRLWLSKDIYHVLQENKGRDAVEGIILDKPEKGTGYLNGKSFSNMSNLRLLKISNFQLLEGLEYLSNKLRLLDWHGYSSATLPSSFYPEIRTNEVEGIMLDNPKKDIRNMKGKSFSTMSKLKLLKISNVHSADEHLEYLSNELRFLKWHGYPFKSLPSGFNPENLYELKMCYNNIERLWDGVKSLEKLKVVKLKHSYKLIRTPDFTEAPNLERLDLEGCLSLLEVHWSVGLLKKLTILNLKDCKKLESFPSDIRGLTSLKILNLFGCSNLEKLPQNIGEANLLEELDVSETAIREVPDSIRQLTKLRTLSFHGCRGQTRKIWRRYYEWFKMVCRGSWSSLCLHLPPLTGLSSLTKLDLGDCNLSDGAIPSDIGSLSSLEELNLRGNNFVTLPESINQLSELKIFCLEKCRMLKTLPQLPPKVIFLGLEDCDSFETLPNTLLQLCTSPKIALHFFNCFKLAKNHESENILADIFWTCWLQKFCCHSSQFYIRLPGSEIPKWFTCWRSDSSIEIKLPPDWLNDDFVGFAFCAVLPSLATYLSVTPIVIYCQLRIGRFKFSIRFGIPSFTMIKSDHLCLGFLSFKAIKRGIRLNYERLSQYVGSQVRLAFDIRGKDEKDYWHASVRKCGIRPVYKQEVNCLGSHHNCEELPLAKRSIIEQNHDEWNPLDNEWDRCVSRYSRICMPDVLLYSNIREFYEGFPSWNLRDH